MALFDPTPYLINHLCTAFSFSLSFCHHQFESGKYIRRKFPLTLSEGTWEPNTFDILDTFLDNNHSYVDIGASIGITCLYGCQLAKHCYAVEPDPIAFEVLHKNINLNPSLKSKITPSGYCISNVNGVALLGNRTSARGGDNQSSLFFQDAPLTWKVPSTTLKHFFEELVIQDCNFIKMDIEGAEAIVLPECINYIIENQITLLVAIHPKIFGDDFDSITLEIVDILRNFKHVFSSYGLEIDPNVLLNDGMNGLSYELLATFLPVEAFKKTSWTKKLRVMR